MAERCLSAYRDGRSWYVDDDNGFSRMENELVAGVPELIETLAGVDATRVRIRYSAAPFEGAHSLRLAGSNHDGATYTVDEAVRPGTIWLCRVFFHYFDNAPPRLFVAIVKE
jgi:hypothetical protein